MSSTIISESNSTFSELDELQLGEIKDAIQEADAEDFASDENMTKLLEKWSLAISVRA